MICHGNHRVLQDQNEAAILHVGTQAVETACQASNVGQQATTE
jgi:hypothetical protein